MVLGCHRRLPSKGNTTPGLELVMFSRATSQFVLAIDDSEGDITYDQFTRIGKGRAYDKRREFEPRMRDMAEETQREFRQRIIQEDPNQESPTFQGGFEACVQWYRDFISARDL